jgi:hypothetical protein
MIQAAGEYDFGLISKVFLLGFIRYLVFSCQFFLLVRLFGNPIPVHQLITGIGLTYLVITFLPFSSILELGIRGSVAAFVFSLFTFQTGNIVLATLAIWIVNLGIPALIGAMLLYQSNTLTFAQLSLKKHLKPAIKKLN